MKYRRQGIIVFGHTVLPYEVDFGCSVAPCHDSNYSSGDVILLLTNPSESVNCRPLLHHGDSVFGLLIITAFSRRLSLCLLYPMHSRLWGLPSLFSREVPLPGRATLSSPSVASLLTLGDWSGGSCLNILGHY